MPFEPRTLGRTGLRVGPLGLASSYGLREPGIDRTPDGGDCYRFVLSRPEVDVCLSAPKDEVELDIGLAALERGPMREDELTWMQGVGDRLYEARKGRGETGFMNR